MIECGNSLVGYGGYAGNLLECDEDDEDPMQVDEEEPATAIVADDAVILFEDSRTECIDATANSELMDEATSVQVIDEQSVSKPIELTDSGCVTADLTIKATDSVSIE